MKKAIKILQSYAHTQGREMQSIFADMLDFFIETFSTANFMKFKGDMSQLFLWRKNVNPLMYELLENWITLAEESITKNGISDFFGEFYECMFLGKTKASALGQFFTPLPLCQIMASLLQSPGSIIVNEPACGSGRNILAHWQYADKSKLIEYRCEDLDPISVKMCALNMMINGMYGQVICHDALVPDSFHFGYAINEIRYPFPSPFYSIRYIPKTKL